MTSKLTKKQKKGLAFRERKSKKQSRAVPDDEMAIPESDSPVGEEAENNMSDVRMTPEGKNTKKRKREVDEDGGGGVEEAAGVAQRRTVGFNSDTEAEQGRAKLHKKRKTAEKGGNETTSVASGRPRYILFVGNLKYTTSLEEVRKHFSNCDPPPQIRLLTPKPPKSSASSSRTTAGKSKGCAFLEFSHRNALQQGLKLHGSTLDGRRINVELTAGGGGKGEKRVEKVKARNKHLLEERKTRVQKMAESGGEVAETLTALPQRHSTTSGSEEAVQKRRTRSVPEEGEVSGRGGVKKRGRKMKRPAKHWGTGANAIAVG